jgi:tetratricopeptide (TPR) repeat protein
MARPLLTMTTMFGVARGHDVSLEQPRTLLEQLAADEQRTWPELTEQFKQHARELHRESGEPTATLSWEHLQRIAAGKVSHPHPSTARVLQRQFGRPIGELLGPPEQWRHTPCTGGQDSTPDARQATLVGRRDQSEASAGEREQAESLRQGLDDLLSSGAMAEASLDDWERIVISHGRATRDRPAGILLDDLSADLVELRTAIERHRSVSALRRLTRVAAHMSGLMCLTFCKLDNRSSFRKWARTARLAANEAGDTVTLSWVLAQEAYGHYYSGDLREAIDIAQHAQHIVSLSPCVGSALAAALEARAHATIGNHTETQAALNNAERVLSHLKGDQLSPSAFGYNEAQLRFHEGNAYTHLRDVRAAFKAQDRALQICAPGDYTDWSMTRLDRASCLANSGDAADGITYAIETLTNLTESQRQGIIAARAREVVNDLPRAQKGLPVARDLRDLLMITS